MEPDDRDFLADLFRDDHPRDVVPGSGLTREDVLRMDAMTGRAVTATYPGQVLTDLDGVPIGVEPSRTEQITFGGVALTLRQLAELDLTPEDVPNVRILPDPK
ncbi:hypothetical protein [Rhodococcus sp. AH-ZY2]|uniref:hypothetical protein n=1 Tax=Rhodococcus sp. AH-ZY2 TaxID=3047468 RepID=UPI0027E1ACE8|nr:hypothetical protein [Rhodococcus sp. AH-ZY2]WML63204.1 hypothetical protein QNA09_25915 [Rhodococcus sp. AH-ZY2]WML64270.1 hypothetical protein QNA09_05560 [Rhodococcus sp. AH-ZY2]